MLYKSWWSPWASRLGLKGRFTVAFGNKTALGGVYRQEDFEDWLKSFDTGLDGAIWLVQPDDIRLDDVMNAIIKWTRSKSLFAFKRGTGIYNQNQLNLYTKIESHLQARSPVCLGTRAAVGTAEPTPGSSGEPISKGFAGKHGYAVLATRNVNGLRFVQVYNPWGQMGRGYSFAPPELHMKPNAKGLVQVGEKRLTAYETDSPIFWLELADVTKRCDKLYTCKTVPPLARYYAKRNLYL